MTVADRIGVMNQGRLMQVATPPEVYEQPNSRWVADFIGDVNLIEGGASTSGAGATHGRKRGRRPAACRRRSPMRTPGDAVWVALRPEKIAHRARSAGRGRRQLRSPAASSSIGYLGDISIYKVKLDNGSV